MSFFLRNIPSKTVLAQLVCASTKCLIPPNVQMMKVMRYTGMLFLGLNCALKLLVVMLL